MKNMLLKDTFREIRKSKGRFLSILAIVALGVAFFAGIKVASPDMKITADTYYDDQNYRDIKIVSTMGFDNKDVDKIKSLKDIKDVFPTYTMDAITSINSKDIVVKVLGMDIGDKLEENLDMPKIVEGRYPEKQGECLVERSKLAEFNLKLGDVVKLSSGLDTDIKDNLDKDEYTVVGIVDSPKYISYEKGNSNIGNGNVSNFIIIPKEDFKLPVYTELLVTVNNAKELFTYGDDYFDLVDPVKKTIEDLGKEINEDKYNEIVEQANLAIKENKEKLEEMKKIPEVYLNANPELRDTLNSSQEAIKKAEEDVKNITKPEWYVLDRNSDYSFVDYEGSADRVDAIAKVFPLFFFLVAALVCLTTMTRMVDEERVYIGTLKALGYSKLKIARKYIVYASIASLLGSAVGIAIGFTLFPTVIANAYGIMYSIPPVIKTFNVKFASIATISFVLTTTLAASLACYKELMETPALLMRPKAPKEGKRILLERITFIWKRFNFTEKVTARNIFRYKKRFFMTVIGIAGCTALILAGFGIRDSIETIVDKQYGEIFNYDASIGIDSKKSKDIDEYVSNNKDISSYLKVESRNLKVYTDSDKKDAQGFIPESPDKLKDFVALRKRTSKNEVTLSKDGVVITEKLAKQLNVKIGDTIKIEGDKKHTVEAKVTDIAENYVSHFVYMGPEVYENLYGEKPSYNNILLKTVDTSEGFENALSQEVLDIDGVSSINFNSAIKNNFKDTIASLKYVVIVMIISAGALAFVVLYNLTNVNISERLREIATIKVLGFYDREVSSYVFRENIILTFIGMIAGLGLGILLHRFIMVTAELDNVMFGRSIYPMSYVYSAILTIVFAFIVNLVMYYKLKKIKMVESLKSVD